MHAILQGFKEVRHSKNLASTEEKQCWHGHVGDQPRPGAPVMTFDGFPQRLSEFPRCWVVSRSKAWTSPVWTSSTGSAPPNGLCWGGEGGNHGFPGFFWDGMWLPRRLRNLEVNSLKRFVGLAAMELESEWKRVALMIAGCWLLDLPYSNCSLVTIKLQLVNSGPSKTLVCFATVDVEDFADARFSGCFESKNLVLHHFRKPKNHSFEERWNLGNAPRPGPFSIGLVAQPFSVPKKMGWEKVLLLLNVRRFGSQRIAAGRGICGGHLSTKTLQTWELMWMMWMI